MTNQKLPEYLNEIALCLPGGGFRASSFSLGILSFIHSVGLQQSLKKISTVSGGTITGAKYAYMCSKGESFENFYTETYTWLLNNDLFVKALANLPNKKNFPYKSQNVINACSIEYRKFVPIVFSDLEEGLKKYSGELGLRSVVFNATDFENGLPFRFKNEPKFGNDKNQDLSKFKPYIELGDIIAASSCFPGGFEPIIFPKDFISPETLLQIKQELTQENNEMQMVPEDFGLMDGGIIDNQGISSILGNLGQTSYYFIIADAGNYKIQKYRSSNNSKWAKLLNLLFSRWSLVGTLGIILMIIYFKMFNFVILPVIILSILISLQVLLQIVVHFAKDYLNLNKALKIPNRKIGTYIIDRVNSLLLLNSSIFLKASKSDNLKSIYSKHGKNSSKLSIYRFICKDGIPVNIREWEKIKNYTGEISPFLQKLSEYAANYPTTLWFSDNEAKQAALNKLVLCGEAICCFTLLKKMIVDDNSENQFFIMLLEKWKKFNSIPIERFEKMGSFYESGMA